MSQNGSSIIQIGILPRKFKYKCIIPMIFSGIFCLVIKSKRENEKYVISNLCMPQVSLSLGAATNQFEKPVLVLARSLKSSNIGIGTWIREGSSVA